MSFGEGKKIFYTVSMVGDISFTLLSTVSTLIFLGDISNDTAASRKLSLSEKKTYFQIVNLSRAVTWSMVILAVERVYSVYILNK